MSTYTSLRFLIEKFGKNKIFQFLKNIPENNGTRESFVEFSEFFSEFFNVGFKETVQEWQKSTTQKKISE